MIRTILTKHLIHVARSREGALLLAFFLAPNTFLTEAQPEVRTGSPAGAWGVR